MDPAEEYKMNHKRRGLALIFNQEHFFWHLRMPPRNGTNADRSNLVKRYTWHQIGPCFITPYRPVQSTVVLMELFKMFFA